jgi:hypothetical protein
MYDKSDPRGSLASGSAAAAGPTAQSFAGAEYAKFHELPPQQSTDAYQAWFARGQNFLTVYVQAEKGAVFKRDAQLDEYVVLVPDANGGVQLAWEDETLLVKGSTISMVPPGKSTITFTQAGRYVLLFSTQNQDLVSLCVNNASYSEPHPNIPAWKPWPNPAEGWKLRSYSLDVPDEPGRFGRIWRCSTMMVNFLPPQTGPRDITKLSPHYHDTFEQGSFSLDGAFTHHIRWPWTTNLHAWRPDDHALCGSPSLAVIPPPAIHTSRGMNQGVNQLIDLFSPPRVDFSMKEGWVLNASDYPMPSE